MKKRKLQTQLVTAILLLGFLFLGSFAYAQSKNIYGFYSYKIPGEKKIYYSEISYLNCNVWDDKLRAMGWGFINGLQKEYNLNNDDLSLSDLVDDFSDSTTGKLFTSKNSAKKAKSLSIDQYKKKGYTIIKKEFKLTCKLHDQYLDQMMMNY